jgi:hypothetical protein
MAPKIKHRARIKLINQNGTVVENRVDDSTYLDSYGAYLRIPVPKIIGKTVTYTVAVEYLGEHQYKQTLAQRTRAHERNQERTKKWKEEQAKQELENQEKQLIQRRNRIMNQIELAFVKKGKEAVNFVTCDKCDAMATFLGLAFENPGSTVIDPDQITGAWCKEHDNKYARPFKTKAAIACELLEFFYDGLRQIYVSPSGVSPQ